MKLSILIPARDEEFLLHTVKDIIEHIEGDTDIWVGLDGWTKRKPILDLLTLPRVNIETTSVSIGQRAMTNVLARESEGEYLMKVDAHCSFSQGFDVRMLEDMKEDTTLVPVLLNLHAYDWVCPQGHRLYQGRQPEHCVCGIADLRKTLVWQIKPKPVFSNFYFDTNLIFQNNIPQSDAMVSETMALQGSGWMVSRKKYFELNLSDESFGSWGQQGVEIACKTWLSGGTLLCTKKAYMGHLFRQGDDFPYVRDMEAVDRTYQRSKDIFLHDNWPLQTRPLSWLVEKFKPLPDWHDERGKKVLDEVMQRGLHFKNVV